MMIDLADVQSCSVSSWGQKLKNLVESGFNRLGWITAHITGQISDLCDGFLEMFQEPLKKDAFNS